MTVENFKKHAENLKANNRMPELMVMRDNIERHLKNAVPSRAPGLQERLEIVKNLIGVSESKPKESNKKSK